MIRWGVADDGTVDVGVEEVAYPKAKAESQAISTAIRKKLVEKGYTLKNVKTLFDSDAYLDNMHVREIRHKTAKVYGVHPDTLPNQREGQRKEWYYGLKNPSFGEEESLEQTRTKYLEEHQGRFPFSIALSFVKRPETEKYVLPLVEKDVPEPIIKKMITHPDEQVRIGLTSRSLKDLADVPMSQKFWVNMTPAMMQKLGAENQPAKVRAHVLLSKNPLPEGLKEDILSAPNVANVLIREVTIDESLAKDLLKTHKSPDIRSAFIEHRLREEWMSWAVPLLLEGNNTQVIKQLIDYKASQLPRSVLLKLCGSDSLPIKQAILGNLSEVRLDGKCIQALLTKGAPLSDDNMSYLFRNVGEDILSALDLKTTKIIVAREDPDLIERVLTLKLHNTSFGHQTNPTSIAERNAIWKEVLKQDEITSTVVSYICMDTNLDINLLKKVISRFLPDDNFLPLLIQYTTSAPSKHLLFQYIKKEKLDTSDKIMLYKGLLTDLDTNNVLYSTIKKELLRLTTGTTTKK
jgi:hypothetical protein